MSRIVSEIKKMEGVLSLNPAKSDIISSAENQLDLKFSDEYKEYTSTYGAISINGTEYTGVVDDINLNVVMVTRSARAITTNIPIDWYVVMDSHIDGIIIWQNHNGIIYQTEPHKEPQKVSDTLLDYILSNV